ncbi:hypothetical protein DL96DRAFT_1685613 [Flagelloscypha sp. PMI_526]|nr:hypothetical protein DL96DRAFT_1685613 [Flagelloscypha sp. PMI_526]
MRPSQPKDLKSFFGMRVSRGHPHTHSHLNQGTLRPASETDTSLNAAGTVLQLAKDAGDAASKVPYVKAVAGVLSQIIKIREEIQANKERCDEIIDLVHSKTTIILQALDRVYHTNGDGEFEDLRSDLEAYADLLRGVLRDDLEPCKAQSRWTSYINRGKKASDLQKLERQLDHFGEVFSVKRLVSISVDARNTANLLSKPMPPTLDIPQALPISPEIVIGRDTVVEDAVQAVLSSSRPRVALLGPGGIGKTTIGTTVLHDHRITSAYPTKYFISSELTPTTELLEICIADALSIPQSERGVGLVSQIADSIHRKPHPVLLYIDNLETVWEVESEQPKVDRFLDVLSGASTRLAILVTMRGTQEPKTSFLWNSMVIAGLDTPNSILMFESLSQKPADVSARELLLKLSGSPLAIKLFSLMVKEGDRPSQILSSWNKHGAKALEIGGRHRLSSLEQSIHLSVFSPRIDDTGRLVLGLIALMPDGLSTSSPWFEGFESFLPDKMPLPQTLRALRRMALLDENGDPLRWQMLPPIREFCLRLIDSTSPSKVSLVEFYIKTLTEHWDYTTSTSQAIIVPEMANIRGLLLHGIGIPLHIPLLGKSGVQYVDWARWQNIDESAILPSFLPLSVSPGEQADIYLSLGYAHTRWNRLEAAISPFNRALQLYREVQDRLGEANTHKSIGNLYVRRGELNAAEASFNQALELYADIQDRLGEAKAHESIGNLHMRRDRLDTAEASFTHSLALYREVQNRLGEANTHKSLGNLHERQDRLDEAETSFARALELYCQVHNRVGEAITHQSIGNLHMRRAQPDAAETSYVRALELYRQVQSRVGEASAYKSIGNLQMRRARLDPAEESFTRALELYWEAQDLLGEASTHKSFGDLHVRRGRLSAAEESFTRALELYREVQSRLGEANAHKSIGDLHMRRDRLDEAEASLNRALKLYREIQNRRGESQTLKLIDSIHQRRYQLETAPLSPGEETL